MVPEIKICGITNQNEIEFLNGLPVQYIGFVFANSKRQVTPAMATELAGKLRSGIKRVGVFTDTPIPEIGRIVELCRLDYVQLHGECRDTDIRSIRCPVWKGISMKSPACADKLIKYPSADAFILDTYVPGERGGTGRSFQWEWAEGLSARYKVVLAGGLNSENIGRAISIVRPNIVDVSSGVEGADGKDEQKVKEFIKAVRFGKS